MSTALNLVFEWPIFCLFGEEKNKGTAVFATKSNILMPISMKPLGVNLRHFKLRLFSIT